jgi:hypothetical protein
MARLDTTATALTTELFTMAGKLAKTDAESAVLETELTLELNYQQRMVRSMARRRTTNCSRLNSPELQHIAGWN